MYHDLLKRCAWLSFSISCALASQSSGSAGSTGSCGGGGGGASGFTITVVQPSLCTSSALQYSLKTAVPTGQVRIAPDQTAGWGVPGSIWNFTLDDGAKFSSLEAPCQGSACTDLVGTTNMQSSGQITQNSDGVWSLNVTNNMSPSVGVFGVFCGGNPVDGKVDLIITSTPPCALPIAQNCTNSTFDPSADQWAAYSVDDWLSRYMSKNSLQDYHALYKKLTTDYLSPTEKHALVCTPDSPDYSCTPPSGTNLQQQCSSIDATQGLLALTGLVRISNTLHALWQTFQYVGSDVSSWVNNIVDQFLVPSMEQKWQAIVSAVSSIIGVLAFLFTFVDGLTEGATTGVFLAVIVGITSALSAASNFATGFWSQKPDDTYLTYTGNYDQGINYYVDYMSNSTADLWYPSNPAGLGASVVENSMKRGSWTNIGDPLDVPHLGNSMKYFFDTLLVTSLINQIWKNNGFFIVFIPYGEVTDYLRRPNSTPGNVSFTSDECNNHWVNDPQRTNYISCNLNYGGKDGMAVLTEPSSIGGTLPLSKSKFTAPEIAFTFNTDDAMQASLTANSQYGFNYNFTTEQLEKDVTAGAIKIDTEFKSLPASTPGLYNLDVCVMTQKSYIPGSREYIVANQDWYYFWPDPCICAGFQSHGQTFSNVAISAAINATTTDSNGKKCMDQLQDLSGLVSEQFGGGGV